MEHSNRKEKKRIDLNDRKSLFKYNRKWNFCGWSVVCIEQTNRLTSSRLILKNQLSIEKGKKYNWNQKKHTHTHIVTHWGETWAMCDLVNDTEWKKNRYASIWPSSYDFTSVRTYRTQQVNNKNKSQKTTRLQFTVFRDECVNS